MLTDIRNNIEITQHVDAMLNDGKTKLAIVSECMRIFSHLYPDMNNFIAWNNLIQKYIDNRDGQNVQNNTLQSSEFKSDTITHAGKQESDFREYLIKLGYKKSMIDSVICNIQHFDYNSKGISGKTSVAFLDICTIDKFNDVVKKIWKSESNIIVSMKQKYSNALLLYKDYLCSLPKQEFDPFAFLKKDLQTESCDIPKTLCADLVIKAFRNWCLNDETGKQHSGKTTKELIDEISYVSSRLFNDSNVIFTFTQKELNKNMVAIHAAVNAAYGHSNLRKSCNKAIFHYSLFLKQADIKSLQANAVVKGAQIDNTEKAASQFSYNSHDFLWHKGDNVLLSDLFSNSTTFLGDPSYFFRRRSLFVFMKSATVSLLTLGKEYNIPANVETFKNNYKEKYGTKAVRMFLFEYDDNKVAKFYDEVSFVEAKDKSILVRSKIY